MILATKLFHPHLRSTHPGTTRGKETTIIMAGMTLYFTRAKCFVHQTADSGTKTHLAQPGPHPQANVPFWVAETPTFAHGVKDGSIVNLTPPHLMPGYVYPTVEAAEAEQAAIAVAEAEEPPVVPQAPFGGQPLQPVQSPAKRVGNVTASTGRK